MNQLNQLNKRVKDILDIPLVINALRLVALVYAGMAAPRLSPEITALFDNDYFKMAFLAFIVLVGTKDLTLSILLAVGFVLTMNQLSKIKIMEGFKVEQNTNVLPECLGKTPADLLTMFDNDENALFEAMRNSNVPLNLDPTDPEDVPAIMTYLLNFGYSIDENCKLPPQ